MLTYTLTALTTGLPMGCGTFEAPNANDALWFSRGYVNALSELRPDFEIGARYRLDRVVIRNNEAILDNSTFEGECDVVEKNGRVGAIWRVPVRQPSSR